MLLLVSASPLLAGKPDPKPEMPRVGTAQPIRVVPEPGRFVRVAGGMIWRDKVIVPGAAFLKPRFANFNLAPGDELTVSSKSGEVVEVLRLLGPRDAGSFWGLSAFGDEIHFELKARARYTKPPFEIEQMIVGDARVLAEIAHHASRSICAPEDYDDAICFQGDAAKWANVMASAGVMTTGGGFSLWCSGANISPQNFLLTNYHCIPDFAPCASAEFVFNYHRTSCNVGAGTGGVWVGYRCGQTVASSPLGDCDPTLSTLDFSLNTVVGDPASSFGFVQVDPTPLTSGEPIYIVQHPDGRPHEITHGQGANVVVDINAGAGTRTLRYYDSLDTEGGSSGSPIFRESDDKMVALHHCGGCEEAGVGNRGMLMSDIYPAIEPFLCSPGVALEAGAPQELSEVQGNGDTFLDPGETWSLRPVLRNRACAGDATAVSANVVARAGSVSITLLDVAATFGTIPAGTGAASQGTIGFRVNEGIPCAGEVVLDLVAISSNGGQNHPDAEALRQALGSLPTTGLFYEGFAAGIPAGFTLVDGGTGSGSAATWTTANPGSRVLLVPPFAIVDSDSLGSGFAMDEQLITPPVDTTGYSHVSLELEHAFRYFDGNLSELADIDVRSSATANAWVNLRQFTGSDASGHLSIDLTPYVAADLQIRFHYYNASYEWYWAIDDLSVRGDNGRVCAAGPLFADGFESADTGVWSLTLP